MPSSHFQIPLTRSEPPGLATLIAHGAALVFLALVVILLWPLRVGFAWVAEMLIRVSDAASDALRERLSR